jgi:hypothetical protein
VIKFERQVEITAGDRLEIKIADVAGHRHEGDI